MEEFILITFYNRQTTEIPSWEVYGHTAPGRNRMLMSFVLREHAISYAHTFSGIPVLQGTGSSYDHILKLLYDR